MHPGVIAVNPNPALDRMEEVVGFALGHPLRAYQVTLYPGGSATHAALVAAQLGVRPVHVVAPVGGATGQQWVARAESWGLLVDPVAISGETRTNVSIVDRDHGAEIECIEPGPIVNGTVVEDLVEVIHHVMIPGMVGILGGSVPPGWPSGGITDVMQAIREDGGIVVVDVAGPALREAIAYEADWIKVNREEFINGAMDLAEPHPINIWRELQAWPRSRSHVVVSLDQWGALWRSPSGAIAFVAPVAQAAVFNPIGSGDAMVGAMAAGLVAGIVPPEMLKMAMAAAASNMAWVEAGRVDPTVVEDLRQQVAWGWVTTEGEVEQWMHRWENDCD
jgi:1-phosphofructokinase family hexose kinase